jgi:EmrB/QacA subfamily drug resistance transporter
MTGAASEPGRAIGVGQPASPWTIFWIASIAVFLVSMDSTVLFAAFSAIGETFRGTSPADMSWVLNGYTVVYAAMLIPAGGVADTHGRKKVFLWGVFLFLAASAACGLAGSVNWLVAARVAQAVGAALLTPASLSIVLDAFPHGKRALTVSLWGAVGGLAAAVGPSLGSFVVDAVGWQWAFYLNLPLGAVSLWRGAALLRDAKRPEHRPSVDWVGMALLVLGVGAISLCIVQLDSPRWTGAELVSAAAVGAGALACFVAWAKLASAPLVDPKLFREPTYTFANLATLAFGMAFSMMFFAFFFYLTQVWHYGLTQAGLAITPGPLLVIPVAVLSGRLAGRVGHRPFLVGGGLLHACSGLWFLLVPGAQAAYLTEWLPGLVLSGVSVGLVLPALSAAAVNRLPPAQYAVGSAVNQATRQIGSVLGVALTVLLLGPGGLTHASFVPLYGCYALLALLTALLSLPIDTKPLRS